MSQSQEDKGLRRAKLSGSVPPQESISKKAAINALWRRGILNWKLDENQLQMYDFVYNSEHPIVVISASRQIGKSFFLFTVASEYCQKNPGHSVVIVAPQLKQIKRISSARMADILQDCPSDDLKPKYKQNEHVWEFPNGSKIYLAGTDNENYDSIRGITAHLCIVDEAGFCTNLGHIISSILIPTTTTTGGKIVLSSTPPTSLDHDFITYMHDAQDNDAFIQRTIYDNPRLSEADIERIATGVGGKDSPDFRREYLCELITDPEFAVVPEFADAKEDIIKEWPRPKFFDSYTSMDIGGNDLTVLLFAYYDFKNSSVIIEDELVVRRQEHVTDYIASETKRKEQNLWQNPAISNDYKPVYKRVSDNNNIILLNDLTIKHKLTFHPTDKDDNIAAINNMRLLIKQKRVIINPRCYTLIDHLENGIWNKTKTKYARSADKGHFDAIDALKYLCRNIDFHRNPYPAQYTGGDDFFVLPEAKERTNTEQTIMNIMRNPHNRKKRRY